MNPSNSQFNPATPGGGLRPGQNSTPGSVPVPPVPLVPPQPPAPAGRYIDGISPVRPQQPSTLDISAIDTARLPGIHTPTAPHSAPMDYGLGPKSSSAPQQPHAMSHHVQNFPETPTQGFGQPENINDILPHGVRPMRPANEEQQGPVATAEQIQAYQERLRAIENALPPAAPYTAQQAPQPAPAPPVYPPLDQVVTSPVQQQPVQYQQQPQAPVYQPAQTYAQPAPQQQEYSRPTDYLEPMAAEQSPQPYTDAYVNSQAAPQPTIIASDNDKSSSFALPGFSKLGRSLASVMGLILLVWGGAAVLNAFVFQSYYVDGLSMLPTLHDNDRLIISRVEKTSSEIGRHAYVPQRGHIVVIDSAVSPLTASRDEQLIKRVVGLPGETVTIDGGRVIIKNQSRPEGFDVDKELQITVPDTYVDAPLTLTIPDDSVFVMGDNRGPNGSYDSRAFGPVPVTMVEGRLWIRVLPFDKLKVF